MTTFYNLVDPKLNWGVSFHYNPLYLLLAQVQEGKEIYYLPLSYLLFCQAFFFLPILFGLFQKFRFSMPFIVGAFSSLFFSIFVTDYLFWSSLHVLPLVTLALGRIQKSPQLKVPLALTSALLWAWCSGPLAFLGSFFLLWLIIEEDSSVKLLFLGCALVSSVLFLIPFPMPKFPEGSQLAQISPSTFWPTPLWGPILNPNPLNFTEYLTRVSGLLSTALTNVILAATLLFQLRNQGNIAKQLQVVLFTSIFILFESISSGLITQNLSTVMFGLPLLPFPWLLSSIGVLVGFGLFLNSSADDNLPFSLGFIILVFFYLSNLITNFDGNVVEAQTVGTQFSKQISHNLAQAIPVHYNLLPLKQVDIHVTINQEQAKFLVDPEFKTSWSSGVPMTGNEVIELKLKEAINCSVLSFSPGGTNTDFPRGIKVEVSQDNVNYRTAAEIKDWKGPIRVTNDGFLYYGPQGEVELRLENAEKVSGLKIYQTAKDKFYFWSVAEVRCGS